MTTQTIEIQDLETQLHELMPLVLQGTEVIFAQNDTPLARLIPISNSQVKPRVAGLHKGSIWMSDDFDEALADEFWLGKSV